MDLAATVRTIPDFPKPGILFRDITTLLQNPEAFRYVIETWRARYAENNATAIVGADARGFIFGGALAYALGLPFVPARKRGKLPWKTIQQEFALEYGTDVVEMNVDALKPGDRVILIDDLLATGGTMAAIAALVRQLGAEIIEAAFVIELPGLKGRDKLAGIPVHTLVEFEGE